MSPYNKTSRLGEIKNRNSKGINDSSATNDQN